jgi:uncharacterized FAD-dependent dehydrogenase
MKYQQEVETKAFAYGGGKFVAPAQRMVDFFENKVSNSLPACSYLPGLHSVALKKCYLHLFSKIYGQPLKNMVKK